MAKQIGKEKLKRVSGGAGTQSKGKKRRAAVLAVAKKKDPTVGFRPPTKRK
ncbi:MAG: hypothetical protein ACE365_06985 [Gammaproteobacteria bacterium]